MPHPIYELNEAAAEAGLEYLMIGGHAVAIHGVPRFTRDLDLLVCREVVNDWKKFLEAWGFRIFFESDAFLQFESPDATRQPIDLMLVDPATWGKLSGAAVKIKLGSDLYVRVPDARHLIAMKLRAALSVTRREEAQDWNDVLGIIDAQNLSIEDPEFRELVERFGGDSAVGRLERRNLNRGEE
jgi:hypothetical protein